MKTTIVILILIAAIIAVAIKATDQICKKPFSEEFKQTQQYKGMQCPNK